MAIEPDLNAIVAGQRYDLSLEEVEDLLRGED